MKLSVCMIVKDEALNLEKTLPSLSRHADEIIVLDTGSTDNTIAVAEKYGARVYRFTWINDFSAARNQSLQYATGDFILWADADELCTDEELAKLKEILSTSKAKAFALNLYECDLDTCEKKSGYPRVKVFRNGQGYHFVRPINEQLIDQQEKIVEGETIPVAIYHWGAYLGKEKMALKNKRYVEWYSAALEQSPDDAHIHFLLANKLTALGRKEEALEHYTRAADLAKGTAFGIESLEKRADILLQLKKLPEAAAAVEELTTIDPNNIPARNVAASIMLVIGKVDNAIAILQEALSLKVEGRIESIYQTQAMPNLLLGKAYDLKGEKEKAQDHYAVVRKIAPELLGGRS
jgi:tetratricopeptide (TPR) repeat protein